MGWSTTSDLEQFAAAAGGYLTARTAENSLLLTAAQAARSGPGTPGLLFGWWTASDGMGGPRGAFVHDPSVPLLIAGRVPEMAAGLAVTLAKPGRPVRKVCGVDAPTEAADAFAAAWSQRESISVQAHRMCRVFRLTADRGPFPGMPSWPPPEIPVAAGRLRVAVPADHGMLADWLRVAAIESTERIAAPDEHAADLIGYGGAVFWEVPPRTPGRFLPIGHHRDGAQPGDPGAQPVALATLTRPAAGSVRLSLLYTAQDRRRSGYAAALIQAVSRTLLWEPAAGLPGLLGRGCVREFVMITDMNRPERWGARFGFQLVGERSVLRFGPPTGSLPRAKQTGAQPRLPTGPLPRLPRLRG